MAGSLFRPAIVSLAVAGATATGPQVSLGTSPTFTFGIAGNTITGSAAGGGGAGNTGFISAGGATASLGTVVFSNSNGISFGVAGQTVTASHNGLTSQSNQAVSADNGSVAFQTVSFSNANGVSFSTAAGPAIVASHNGLTSQSSQVVSGSNGSFTFQTIHLSNANGISFGTSAGPAITASYTVPTVTNSSWTVSDSVTSGTVARLAFTNLNGVTLTLSTTTGGSHTLVGSHNGLTSQSNQNVTAANGGFAFQTLSFSNANGFAWSTSAGSAIVGSYTVPTVTNSSWTVSDNATSGTVARLAFTNINGITLSLSTGANGSHTIAGSHNGITSQTNQSLGVYAVGNTTGQSSSSTHDARTLSIDGAGIISVGWSNSTFRISATQSNQAFSAAGGASAFQTLSFSDNSNVSFTNTNGALAVASVRGSLYAVSNTTQSTSLSYNLSALSFHGAGIASVGVSNGSVIVSVPAGGGAGDGGVFAGVSTMGNTAGSTGTVSTGNFVLVGSNLTLSQSTGAAGSHATVTILAPATSSLSATGQVSISVNGSTISIGVPGFTFSQFAPFDEAEGVLANQGQATLHFHPVAFPNIQHDRLALRVFWSNSSNSTGSVTISNWFGIYTKNASTLSLLSSTSTTNAITFSGTGGNHSLQAGQRLLTVPWTNTITAGEYWAACINRTTSGGTNGSYSQLLAQQVASNFSGIFGAASNATLQRRLGQGVYTASTSGLPNSVAFSQINGTGSLAHRPPMWFLISQTA